MKYLKWIITGEFLFALYLGAGSFKSLVPFVDVTILLFVVTIFIALKRLHQSNWKLNKKIILPISLFLIIVVASFISLLYTPSDVYARDKMIRLVIAAWCFVGPFFLFKNKESLIRFLMGVLTLALMICVDMVFGQALSTEIQFSSPEWSNYSSVGRFSAMGLIILMAYLILTKSNKLKKIFVLLMVGVLIIAAIQSGSRAPLLIFIGILAIFPLFFFRIKENDILISKKIIPFVFVLIALVFISISLIQKGYADTLIYRLEVLVNQDNGGRSLYGRTDRMITAWDMSKDSLLLGYGLGSFSIYYLGQDVEDYPHNLYLEILSELGIIPLLSFLLIIGIAIRNGLYVIRKKHLDFSVVSITLLSIFWLVNSMGSSSLTGDKFNYALLAILITMPLLIKENNKMGNSLLGQSLRWS